jgi:phage terminase large subunit-like protein
VTAAEELLAEFRNWNPEVQRKVADMVAAQSEALTKRRVWYCTVGRNCDGQPHEGAAYPHARGDQWPPRGTSWFVWFLRGGRGSGKTKTASEYVRKSTQHVPLIACIGIDTRRIRQTMIEGRSGLIRICEAASISYLWEPSKREFTFGDTGAKAIMYSAEEPDSLRGPEHGLAWMDEPSHYPLIEDVWSNLRLGLRIPGMPGGAKVIATSTPLPNAWTKKVSADPKTVITVASTYANLANLDPAFREAILAEFEGTRLGRQELYGEILDDVEGALWQNAMIQYLPAQDFVALCESMEKVVVAIDPAGSSDRKRDETGIVAVGLRGKEFFVLEDRSGHYTPRGWAKEATALAHKIGANEIVAERNYGGQMVKATLENEDDHGDFRVETVHSRRGKYLRAEPVVARYEQERVWHWPGMDGLEGQMTSWVPATGPSPDRVDALVHGITYLGGGAREASIAVPTSFRIPDRTGMRR